MASSCQIDITSLWRHILLAKSADRVVWCRKIIAVDINAPGVYFGIHCTAGNMEIEQCLCKKRPYDDGSSSSNNNNNNNGNNRENQGASKRWATDCERSCEGEFVNDHISPKLRLWLNPINWSPVHYPTGHRMVLCILSKDAQAFVTYLAQHLDKANQHLKVAVMMMCYTVAKLSHATDIVSIIESCGCEIDETLYVMWMLPWQPTCVHGPISGKNVPLLIQAMAEHNIDDPAMMLHWRHAVVGWAWGGHLEKLEAHLTWDDMRDQHFMALLL